MTIERYRRCDHCQATYTFMVSGWDCHRATNDPNYCPECKQVINEALSHVPPRIEIFFQDCEDVSLAEVQEELTRIERDHLFKEICMPLYDLENPNNHNISGFLYLKNKTIMYSFWTENDSFSIKQKMERDLVTGETYLWRYYSKQI